MNTSTRSMRMLFQHLRPLARLLGATALLFSAWAQNQATLTPLGRWPEFPPSVSHSAKVVGQYAYVSSTDYGNDATLLTILSLADPGRPVRMGSCALADDLGAAYVSTVEVSGHHAFVAATLDHERIFLCVVDVTDPARPVPVAELRLNAWILGSDLSDNTLYLAGHDGLDQGLILVDIGDPLRPRQVGVVPTTNPPHRVRVVGTLAYVGEESATTDSQDAYLEIVDVSSLTAPFVRGGCVAPGQRIHALDVAGGHAYAGLADRGGLAGIDVRDPDAPVLLATVDSSERVTGLLASGTLVYTTGTQGLGTIQPTLVFKVIDVRDPRAPVILGSCPAGAQFCVSRFQLAGRYTYVCELDGFKIFDVGNPAAPSLAGEVEFRVDVSDVVVQGSHAYLRVVWSGATGSGIRVLDVSNTNAPREVGRYSAGSGDWRGGQDMHVAGNRALLLGNNCWELVDLTSPANPARLYRQTTSLRNLSAKIIGNAAYLLQLQYNDDGNLRRTALQILSLANPTSPAILGTCMLTNHYPVGFDVADSYAYIADREAGLLVVDVGSPSSPRLVATVAGEFNSVQVVGRCAYVVDAPYSSYEKPMSLLIIDVSDPLHPVQAGRYRPEGCCDNATWIYGVFVDRDRAYVRRGSGQLEVVNVTNPAQPLLLASTPPHERAGAFQIVDDLVYMVEGAWVSVYKLTLPGSLRLNAPVLSGNTLSLNWNGAAGIKLQRTPSLTNPNWQDVPGSEGANAIELPRTDPSAFFRLMKP